MVSNEIAEKFQEIALRVYDKKISLQEAASIMNDLVDYYDLLAKIHHGELEDPNLPTIT